MVTSSYTSTIRLSKLQYWWVMDWRRINLDFYVRLGNRHPSTCCSVRFSGLNVNTLSYVPVKSQYKGTCLGRWRLRGQKNPSSKFRLKAPPEEVFSTASIRSSSFVYSSATVMCRWTITLPSRRSAPLQLAQELGYYQLYRGCKSNAILYSLVETAKANNPHVYNYINYILEELVKHLDNTDRSFIKDLLPWSDNIRQKCPILKKSWYIFQGSIYKKSPVKWRFLLFYGTHVWVLTRDLGVTPLLATPEISK